MIKNFIFIVALCYSFTLFAEEKNSKFNNLNGNIAERNIVIYGNERIETETILSHVNYANISNIKDQVMHDKISKDLFATGMFSAVKVYEKSNLLHIDVQENAIIHKIYFEGNKKIEDDKIIPYLTLRAKNILNNYSLKNDVNKIIAVYQASGRYSASVIPKIIKLESNRVNLIYEIKEHNKTHIASIDFYGNKYFSDKKINNNIKSKKYRWYRFLSDVDIYQPETIINDADNIKLLYQNNGFAAVEVLDPVIKLSSYKDQAYISYIISEGEKYNFGSVKYNIAIKNITEQELSPLVQTKNNNLFEQKLIDQSIEEITRLLGERGYAFTDVNVVKTLNHENHIVDLIYNILPTPKYYINKINITGNSKTADKIIRREFTLYESDPFNQTKINKTEMRLNDLDYFDKVEVESIQANDNQVDIDVNVKEKSTGYGNFAAGFDGDYGVLGKISYTENNLFGQGKYFSAQLIRAQKDLNFDISYLDPYFMDNNYSAGVDLQHSFNQKRKYLLYSDKTDSIGPKISYELYPDLRHTFGYIFKKQAISNVDVKAPFYIKEQMGKYSASIIQNILTYDKRNSRINSSKGYYVSISQSIAGFGGSKKYILHEFSTAYYKTLINDETIFSLKAAMNHIKGWGGDIVHIEDRFYMGGSNDFRGFKPYGLGPRDKTTNDALGGNRYSLINSQISFPLGAPKELNIKGALFIDVGKLNHIDIKKSYDKNSFIDDNKWRASTGAGILWDGPLGSVGVYYSHVLKANKHDKKKAIVISISTPI